MRSRKEIEAIESAMGVLMAINSNLVELVKKFGGTMGNIYYLATPEGRMKLEEIARIIVSDPAVKVQNQFFKLISSGSTLILDAVDGTETLATARDVFPGGIDPNFINWGADEPGRSTIKTPVDVYEMSKDGEFAQLFGSLFGASSDGVNIDKFIEKHREALRKRCLTQAQIKNFVKKCRAWLRADGYATFFLFESKGDFFVAYVYFYFAVKLAVGIHRFEYSHVWRAEGCHRVVVPQLA